MNTSPSELEDPTSDDISKGELDNSEHNDKESRTRFSLKRLNKVRRKLRSALDERWVDQVAPPAVIEEQILPAVMACVPTNVNVKNLRETLMLHLNGVKLTRSSWDRMATRVAGNIKNIRAKPLTSLFKLKRGCWAVLETTEAEFSKSKKGTSGAMFKYRILTGKAASYYFNRFMPLGFLPKYGQKLGIGKPRWWRLPRLYVGTKLIAFLEECNTAEQVWFEEFYATGACAELNKWYVAGRTAPCIKGEVYKCWQCPRGMLETEAGAQCQYATHRQSWVKRRCHVCKREQWYYSHWNERSACLSCRELATGE